jgi:hypothetical protein
VEQTIAFRRLSIHRGTDDRFSSSVKCERSCFLAQNSVGARKTAPLNGVKKYGHQLTPMKKAKILSVFIGG